MWLYAAAVVAILIAVYLVVAYVVMPLVWIRYARRHPALNEAPGITRTSDDHPGDPINVGLIGMQADLHEIMLKAQWYPADPVTLKSSLEIAAGTILKRPYEQAPVSSLFLWGRQQDLAFEQPVGNDPRRRHHVRFWRSAQVDEENRPLWVGSATFDDRAGLSYTTGEITHHIAGDIDAERQHLFDDLMRTGQLAQVRAIDGFHKVLEGRNGGGDLWRTDGRLFVANIIAPGTK